MTASSPAWSEVDVGARMRWMTPTFVKYGKVVSKKGRSVRMKFDGESKTTVIPDALWYYCQYKAGDKENSLVVWDGPTKDAPPLPDNAHDIWQPAAQAAADFGIKVKDLRRWLRSGKVQGHQRTGLWEVNVVSLGRFLSER